MIVMLCEVGDDDDAMQIGEVDAWQQRQLLRHDVGMYEEWQAWVLLWKKFAQREWVLLPRRLVGVMLHWLVVEQALGVVVVRIQEMLYLGLCERRGLVLVLAEWVQSSVEDS